MTEVELIKDFGNNLKRLLTESSISQRILSKRSGVSEPSISCYIRGERMPSIKHVINIAHVLKCDVYDLIDVDANEIIE